jgi:hypothetical protein
MATAGWDTWNAHTASQNLAMDTALCQRVIGHRCHRVQTHAAAQEHVVLFMGAMPLKPRCGGRRISCTTPAAAGATPPNNNTLCQFKVYLHAMMCQRGRAAGRDTARARGNWKNWCIEIACTTAANTARAGTQHVQEAAGKTGA